MLKSVEYTEGGADYAAFQIRNEQGMLDRNAIHKEVFNNLANNMLYRTGAVGLFAVNDLGKSVSSAAANKLSVWDIYFQNYKDPLPEPNKKVLDTVTKADMKSLNTLLVYTGGDRNFKF